MNSQLFLQYTYEAARDSSFMKVLTTCNTSVTLTSCWYLRCLWVCSRSSNVVSHGTYHYYCPLYRCEGEEHACEAASLQSQDHGLGCDKDAMSEHVLSASLGLLWLIVGFSTPSFRCWNHLWSPLILYQALVCFSHLCPVHCWLDALLRSEFDFLFCDLGRLSAAPLWNGTSLNWDCAESQGSPIRDQARFHVCSEVISVQFSSCHIVSPRAVIICQTFAVHCALSLLMAHASLSRSWEDHFVCR